MPNMMLNMPNRISPMIPTTKLPAQKAMFDVAVTTADNAFHNTFPMSLNIILIFSDLPCSDLEWAVSFSFRLSVCPMFSCDVFRPHWSFSFRGLLKG